MSTFTLFKEKPKGNINKAMQAQNLVQSKILKTKNNNLKRTRPVWTGYKITVRRKLSMHNKTKLQTDYKKVLENINDL